MVGSITFELIKQINFFLVALEKKISFEPFSIN